MRFKELRPWIGYWAPDQREVKPDYTVVELDCKGCMGPCGECYTRPTIQGINYPAPGESWQELNEWRKRYGLKEVGKNWHVNLKPSHLPATAGNAVPISRAAN